MPPRAALRFVRANAAPRGCVLFAPEVWRRLDRPFRRTRLKHLKPVYRLAPHSIQSRWGHKQRAFDVPFDLRKLVRRSSKSGELISESRLSQAPIARGSE